MANYLVHYTFNYEPADMKTLKKLIELKSPYTPLFKIENVEYSVETILSKENTALDMKSNTIWVSVDNMIFKVKMFNSKNVQWDRYCMQVNNLVKLNDQQFLDIKDKVCIDFGVGEASYKQYIKALNQNINIAMQYGLI